MTSDERFRTALVGRVFLARALGTVTQMELSKVLQKVAAARKSVGRPLLYWPVFTGSIEMPSGETRVAMQRATASLFTYCETVTLIIGGSGLKQSLLRTALRGMIAVGGHSSRVKIVTSLADAVSAANDPEIDLRPIEAAAIEAGILSSLAETG